MLVLNVLMTAFIKHFLSPMILDHIVGPRALSVFILLLALCSTVNAPITNVMDGSRDTETFLSCKTETLNVIRRLFYIIKGLLSKRKYSFRLNNPHGGKAEKPCRRIFVNDSYFLVSFLGFPRPRGFTPELNSD